jgi:Na+/H+ antiporter NhaD/arsenite permease-like protein
LRRGTLDVKCDCVMSVLSNVTNLPVPIEFLLFGLTLIGVAVFHHRTLRVSLIGLGAIVLYKLLFTGFAFGPGLSGLAASFVHEWVILTNLLALLTGFALLADFFETSHLPAVLPKFLPHNWKGGFGLLALVWLLSSFLDNIAGALIGGAIAHQVFRTKVHIAFVAAIVAASNAGGAWSVIGDTTTTMMWIAGIPPSHVFHAIIAATVSLFIFGVPAAIVQQKFSPLMKRSESLHRVDWTRVGVVAFVLMLAIATSVLVNTKFRESADRFPFIGVAVWVAITFCAFARRPNWELLPRAFRGSLFLLALVIAAALMPVKHLPSPSWETAFGLGFLSAVFDNIPLTALALKQDGYDWGVLAFTVGFGGSMVWFGSSSGVALCNMYPEARAVGQWIRHGWAIPLSYVISFFVMLAFWGWQPKTTRPNPEPAAVGFRASAGSDAIPATH